MAVVPVTVPANNAAVPSDDENDDADDADAETPAQEAAAIPTTAAYCSPRVWPPRHATSSIISPRRRCCCLCNNPK